MLKYPFVSCFGISALFVCLQDFSQSHEWMWIEFFMGLVT